MHVAFANWPEGHEQQFADVTEFRKWICMKAGYRDLAMRMPMRGVKPELAVILVQAAMKAAGAHAVAVAHKGELCIWAPRSIRFDRMNHLAFCKLNDDVASVIKAEMNVTADELLEGILP